MRNSKWLFDWIKESNTKDRFIYKLTLENNKAIIQGLVSISILSDHIFMDLLETAHFILHLFPSSRILKIVLKK